MEVAADSSARLSIPLGVQIQLVGDIPCCLDFGAIKVLAHQGTLSIKAFVDTPFVLNAFLGEFFHYLERTNSLNHLAQTRQTV